MKPYFKAPVRADSRSSCGIASSLLHFQTECACVECRPEEVIHLMKDFLKPKASL